MKRIIHTIHLQAARFLRACRSAGGYTQIHLVVLAMLMALCAQPSVAAEVTVLASDIQLAAAEGTATFGTLSFSTQRNTGTSTPAYNSSGSDLRVYANNSLKVTATSGNITGMVFTLSTQGKRRLAPVTASTGSVAAQAAGDETLSWTGNASEVALTVGEKADYGSDGNTKAGQLCFTQVVVTIENGSADDFKLYTLTLGTWPANAGSVSPSATDAKMAGSTLAVSTSAYTGFTFKNWTANGEVVSTSRSFTYTMPATDVVLLANYDFNPNSPADPQAQNKKYTLTLSTVPANAGSTSPDSGQKFEAGKSVSLYAYYNTGYVFDHWTSADTIVSTSRSFYFTMPDHDAELKAVYHYDPSSPGDPSPVGKQYCVTLKTVPANAGTFSWNESTKVSAKTSCNIYAYPNAGYKFRGWQQDGQTIGNDQWYSFTMPDEDITLTAIYEFDPANPGNPNKNYWHEETGEVIVDDFTAGNLSSAINTTIGGSSNRDKVQMITVAGPVSQYDWGVVNNYQNCTFLDMSRTYGMTSVPSYNFSGNTVLTTVSLPSGIELIDYYAFRGCSNLSSISIHAATPPQVGNRAFEGVADGFVVYVPADALSLYQSAEVWKDFIILPLANEVSALEVNLPEGTDVSIYKDMYIELINTKSGQKLRYVVTNRATYTFNSLVHRTSYNVYLKNAQGDVLGQIDGIDVDDQDVSVTFPSLLVPRDLTVKVRTPEGQDVTALTTITWTDAKDTYLAKGNKLAGQMEGAKVRFRIVLPQSLGMQYLLPADSLYEVQADNVIDFTLKAIPQTTIAGKVTDVKTGQPLNGATVTVSQMLNGVYSKSLTTVTDSRGQWSLQVYEAKTDVTASMTEYVSKTQSFETPVAEVPAFELKDINGTTIAISLTYQPTGGERLDFYSDYTNVAYSVYNETTGKAVTDLNVQYPQIVLMEQLPEGTVLRVTAASKNQKFVPVSATATVDGLDRASVTLPIVQLGGISATFRQTDNTSVVGILYDANGRLLKKYDYTSATLNISELPDGCYTLVSMASTQLFSAVGSLAQFAEAGLREGADYVKNAVVVKSGETTVIDNPLVPFLDETKLYYTGSGTSVTVNKSQITTGNYLTITGKIDFKSVYADQVSDVKLIVDLPDASSFVENSVMRGNQTGTYIYDGNLVTVPLDYYGERVRFCFIPTAGGDHTVTAQVQFTLGGKTITQPIGNAHFTVKDLSISVPSTVAKATVPVSGTAVGKSTVEIYDGNTLLGQTKALANGTWATTVELNNPYNLSRHSIYAKLTTTTGVEMTTESKEVLYDMNCIEAKTVTMSFYNGWLKKTVQVVFDLQNKSIDEPSYMFYTGTDITFVADLTNNDTTIVNDVTIKVYTDKKNWRTLQAAYNKNIDRWVAVSHFESSELPVGVEVSFVAEPNFLPDMRKGLEDAANIETLIAEYQKSSGLIETLFGQLGEDSTDDDIRAIAEQLGIESSFEEATDENLQGLTEDEIDAYLDGIYNQVVEEDDALIGSIGEFSTWFNLQKTFEESFGEGTTYKLSSCDGLTPEQLLEEGFEATMMADSTTVYTKTDEASIVFVNFSKNVVVTLTLPEKLSRIFKNRRNISPAEFGLKVKEVYDKIREVMETINNIFDGITETAQRPIEKIEQAIEQLNARSSQVRTWKNNCTKNKAKWWKWRLEEIRLQKALASARIARSICKPLVSGLLKCLPIADYISSLVECYQQADKIQGIFNSIPDPCKNDQEKANMCQVECGAALVTVASFAIADVLGNFSADAEIVGGALASVATAGTSLTAVAWGIVQKVAVQVGKALLKNMLTTGLISKIRKDVEKLKCKEDDKCPVCGKNPCECEPPYPTTNPIHDPSGYVYEGVASNRLQGVTATAYYKETVEDMYGDLHENVVLWNAEEYAQENPLFTDEYGMYQWDVPQGLWQVKFEKEGYQTTYSEWLPVPPPQLEVNIAMTQLLQPTVTSAKAYSEGVEVTFDKYMKPETLTADNIFVTRNGEVVDGIVELINEEAAYEGMAQTFASKVRFTVPKEAPLLSTDVVVLTVKKHVESYAGVQMQDTYTQEFDVEPRVTAIVTDELVNVAYGGERTLTVAALPVDASKGKTIRVQSLSTMIATVNSEKLTLDENGQAELKVSGELPGSTVVNFSIDDSDVTGSMTVNVKDAASLVTVAPRASRVSGTEVYHGTEIRLTSETSDAEIWYTLDGSCPCDAVTAIKYNPEKPIIVDTDNLTIKAQARGKDLVESEVVEFTYQLKKTSLAYNLPSGWLWISHNVANAVPVSTFEESGAERIVSQAQETVRDSENGFVGTLTELLPAVGYKVKTSGTGQMTLNGNEWNATQQTVPVSTGWNWIGFPVNQTMTLDEALQFFTPSEGDYIVGQDGFAEYVSGSWNGSLEGMKPGQGYLYKSAVDTDILFNTTIVSKAGSRIGKRKLLNGSPWAVDRYAYPNVMPLTAGLYDNGVKVADNEYVVAAFVESECRGVGLWKDGRLVMSVYGEDDEELRFMAFEPQSAIAYPLTETLTFGSEPVGSWNMPYTLTFDNGTVGIGNLYADVSVTPRVAYDHITVTIGGKDISRVSLTDMSGRTVVNMGTTGKEVTVPVALLPEGVYIVSVVADGQSYYQKIVKSYR